ncbi:hypothetical protein TRVA0_023S02080 [Trichomonascus vanleenenianus]|uniref:uncharacterized protein n=1 Tax=Trichomonascus vanleenenianus TaxID=2268995 RepID=UPI003ECB38D4
MFQQNGPPASNTQTTPQQQLELEQKRVALLLEINTELLKHAIKAKSEAKPNEPNIMYLACMKRLQANLAYLASQADKSKVPPGAGAFPQILSAPGEVPELADLYRKLQMLFPEVVAFMQQQMLRRNRMQQQQQQTMPQNNSFM